MNNLMIFKYLCLLMLLFLVSCGSAVFRHQSPSFTVTYPSYFTETKKTHPLQVFRAVYNYTIFSISVSDIEGKFELTDSAKSEIIGIKSVYPQSCDFAIEKEELITLKDGTRAMFTVIKWRHHPGDTFLIQETVRVIKEKKMISVYGNTPVTTLTDVTEKITHSLEFERAKIAQPKIAGDSMRVAVMDFRANGISQLLASNISELVRNELIIMGSFVVLERSQVDQILKEQGFQMTGCTDTSCAVKVGQMLSAKKILIGTVMRMGSNIVITGRIVDVEKGVGERAANQNASSIDELSEAAGKFARMLTGN